MEKHQEGNGPDILGSPWRLSEARSTKPSPLECAGYRDPALTWDVASLIAAIRGTLCGKPVNSLCKTGDPTSTRIESRRLGSLQFGRVTQVNPLEDHTRSFSTTSSTNVEEIQPEAERRLNAPRSSFPLVHLGSGYLQEDRPSTSPIWREIYTAQDGKH
jgi:hypothetical protein